MGKLEGKVALVTGSGRNIGRATVLKLAGEGAHVVVNARSNRQEADAVAREARDLGVKAVPMLADVGKKAEVERLAAQALSEFGRVDILINNAAIRPHKPFTETTDADWELVRSVVLDGPLYLTRAVIEPMVKNRFGRILYFVGDGAISARGSGRTHLSAAKMGLIGMARGLASEFAPHNIRVNVVSPGSIDTRRDNPEWYRDRLPNADGVPLGRQGSVDEIAATCLFLVSEDGGFITGQTIHVSATPTWLRFHLPVGPDSISAIPGSDPLPHERRQPARRCQLQISNSARRHCNWRRLDDRITTSGQPTEQQLADIQSLGVRHIINLGLHTHEKALPDEAASVSWLGMTYIHIPVDFQNPTDEDFAEFCSAMEQLKEMPVHVHCIANYRVSAFFYRYRRDVLGMNEAEARGEMEQVWHPEGVWATFIGRSC